MRPTYLQTLLFLTFCFYQAEKIQAYGFEHGRSVVAISHYESPDTLPVVFMIGQNELQYEGLVTECSNPLLTVCQDSMDLAYRQWMGMLNEMEQFAEKSEFDIKGIKIWLNVFWDAEGQIRHLVYFPKPNSRNMDFDLLTKFLFKFADNYQMDQPSAACFSHFASATFPTFAEYYLQEKE